MILLKILFRDLYAKNEKKNPIKVKAIALTKNATTTFSEVANAVQNETATLEDRLAEKEKTSKDLKSLT